MTGQELINNIKKYHLEDCDILPTKNGPDGDYICFENKESDRYCKVLWITDDWFRDIIYNHAGDLTYGNNMNAVKKKQTAKEKIFELRKSGVTLRELSIIYGTSQERIRQICKQQKDKQERMNDRKLMISGDKDITFEQCLYEVCEYSRTARKIMFTLDRAKLLEKIESGEMSPNTINDDTLLSIRGFGITMLDLYRKACAMYMSYS